MKRIKLNSKDKGLLYEVMRKEQNIRLRRKAHIILLCAKKFSMNVIASIFEQDERFVQTCINEWNENGTVIFENKVSLENYNHKRINMTNLLSALF